MDEQEAQSPCPTAFLTDDPAEEDEFQGGGHSRVASALASLIRTHNDGKAIALQGTWGSGKSTVVRLLANGLPDEDIRVFLFDAWAHQGDPLRRSFLEKAIESLEGWIDRTKWRRKREELSFRRSRTRTRTLPVLRWNGVVIALLLLLTPAGAALVAGGLASQTAGTTAISWDVLALGIALATAPLMFTLALAIVLSFSLVLRWCYRLVSGSDGGGRLLTRSSWPKFGNLAGPLIPIASQSAHVTLSDSYQGDNPTSVEFERDFRELLRDALAPGQERNLVIVVDNLDRVEPAEALDIWSTLQTFVVSPGGGNDGWANRLWLIVPYDPEGIRALWDHEGATSDDDTPRVLTTYGEVATTFIEKSFQLRVDVPPAVLSDARTFLVRQLKKALANHTDEEFHAVYRLLATSGMKEWQHLTPRNLKMLVNDIAFLHLQWTGAIPAIEFPLSHLCYYVMLRNSGRSIENDLRKGLIQAEAVRLPVGDSIAADLACLRFNVDVDQARQLLLREPITEALQAGDAQALVRLAETGTGGFWEVLEDAAADLVAGEPNPQVLVSVAQAMTGTLLSDRTHESRTVSDSLKVAAERAADFAPFDSRMAEGVGSLLRLTQASSDLVKHVLLSISKSPIGTQDAVTRAVSAESWIRAGLPLVAVLKEDWDDALGPGSIVVPCTASEWLDCAGILLDEDPDGTDWHFFKPASSVHEIEQELAKLVSGGNWTDRATGYVRVTKACVPDAIKGSDLREALEGRTGSPGLSESELSGLIDACWEIELPLRGARILANLIGEGRAYEYFWTAQENQNSSLSSRLMLVLLVTGSGQVPAPGGTPPSRNGHTRYVNILRGSQEPGDLVLGVADLVRRHRVGGGLAQLGSTLEAENESFVLAVLGRLLTQKYAFNPQTVAQNWDVFRRAGPGSFDGFIESLCSNDTFLTEAKKVPFDPRFILPIVRSVGFPDAALKAQCAGGFSTVTGEQWTESLASGGSLVALLVEYKREETGFHLGDAFSSSAIAHVSKLAGGAVSWPRSREDWTFISAAVAPDVRASLRQAVLDALLTYGVEASDSFYMSMADDLMDQALLRETTQLADGVFRPLVTLRRSIEGLRWLERVVERYPRILSSGLTANQRKSLHGAIRNWGKRKSPAAQVIRSIGLKTGIIKN